MALALLSPGKVPEHPSCSPLPRLPPITPWGQTRFTCPLQAEFPILLQHGPLQPELREPSNAGEEKAEGKGRPSKRKEVSLRQPSAIGDREVTEAALSTAGAGRPCCSPRCRSVLAPASPGDCPISHPRACRGTERVMQSTGAAAPARCEQSPIYRCGHG